MSRTRMAAVVLAVAGMVGMATSSAQAQDQQGQQQQDNNRDRGNRGGPGGNWDPAQMRTRMLERLKERLEVKDDEWAVMQPRLDKLMTVRMESMMGGGGGGFMFGRGGDRGGDRGNRPQSTTAVGKARDDLRTTLEDKNVSADTIAAKLKALREAREQSKQELAKAQAEVKEILSQRQEALLVVDGMLE